MCNDWIVKIGRDIVEETFDKLTFFDNIFTFEWYIEVINAMYTMYGEDGYKILDKNQFSREQLIKELKLDNESFLWIKKQLKKFKTDMRRHYLDKIWGVWYELDVGKRFPDWKAADYVMDYFGGWDFIDEEEKSLIQVKHSNSIDFTKFWKNKKWAKANGYGDYKKFILWYNKITNTEHLVEVEED